MGYRSERFESGELVGLQQVWDVVDTLDSGHVPVVNEVMAGAHYRRRAHPDTVAAVGEIDYLLQVTFEPEPWVDGRRLAARHYLDTARELLAAIDLPGDVSVDQGGLQGWDRTTTKEHIFGTGTTETEILRVYPPWLQARWEDVGRKCMFYCGIQPPSPKALLEDWMFNWDERALRKGMIIFTPTPDNLETW